MAGLCLFLQILNSSTALTERHSSACGMLLWGNVGGNMSVLPSFHAEGKVSAELGRSQSGKEGRKLVRNRVQHSLQGKGTENEDTT